MYWLQVVIFFSLGGFSLSLCFCGVRERDRRLFLLFFWGRFERSQEKTAGRVVVGEVGEVVGLW